MIHKLLSLKFDKDVQKLCIEVHHFIDKMLCDFDHEKIPSSMIIYKGCKAYLSSSERYLTLHIIRHRPFDENYKS